MRAVRPAASTPGAVAAAEAGAESPPGLAATTARPAARARSPRVAQIVGTARAILEAEGPDSLTMRRIADELGIRAPSLYKHLPGKPALVVALVEEALDEIGAALHGAVDGAGADAYRRTSALLATYRAFGLANPNLYRLATTVPFPRDALLPGLEQWSGEPFWLATGEPYLAQALWSFAHGTLVLELDHRFTEGSDLERTWQAGADAFGRGAAS